MTFASRVKELLGLENIDSLRVQVQIQAAVTRRKTALRLVHFHVLIFACLSGSHPNLTLGLWIALVLAELGNKELMNSAPDVADMSARHVIVALTFHFLLIAGYAAPALILSLEPRVDYLVAAVVSAMAVLTMITLAYARAATLYTIAALVAFPIAIAVMVNGIINPIMPASLTQMLLPLGLLLAHLAILVALFREHRDIRSDLATARGEALDRLRKLEHMTNHDQLTDLRNRRAFTRSLDSAMGRATAGRLPTLFMIDLDGFKPVNDLYGHEAGDAVLVAVADRLRDLAPRNAQIFRLGGDEFAILLQTGTRQGNRILGDQVAASLRQPINFGRRELRIGGSVGIATADTPQMEPKQLTTNADAAMYLAKTRDGNGVVFYSADEIGDELTEADFARLDAALRGGAIRPHYQPRFTAAEGHYAGAEALARLMDKQGNILYPGDFLDDINKLGMMEDLTHAMLRQILEDISGWLALGRDPGRISINIAEVTLATESGRRDLDWILSQYPGLERHVAFEITEDIYVTRASAAIAASLEHFRKLGVSIVLDDFGVGPGAYPFLQQMTPDELKIDSSLVAQLNGSSNSEIVVGGFVAIARSLGASVTAEGVETEDQREALIRIGCEHVQGHLFGAAIPAKDLSALMDHSEERRDAG